MMDVYNRQFRYNFLMGRLWLFWKGLAKQDFLESEVLAPIPDRVQANTLT